MQGHSGRGGGSAGARHRGDGERGARGERVRAERAGGGLAGVRVQAGVVLAAAALPGHEAQAGRAAGAVRGLERGAREHRRVRSGAVGGADAVHAEGAGRAAAAVRVRADGHVPQAAPGRAEVQLVGLPELGFPKNKGLRIDHLFATAPLVERLAQSDVDREERKGKQPSDHAPVWVEFGATEGRTARRGPEGPRGAIRLGHACDSEDRCFKVEDSMDCDFLIIGSGFGGSVSALRLTEKGYRVLMLEKGRRLPAEDFPKTNWNLKRWLWMPQLGWRGLFKMTFFRHVTVLSGVGVGGGSLVYANTLPIPKDDFFQGGQLGPAGRLEAGAGAALRRRRGGCSGRRRTRCAPTRISCSRRSARRWAARTSSPPPWPSTSASRASPCRTRTSAARARSAPAATRCGGCMMGCRFGAKNTLDKNYLYLAEKRGLTIHADTEVTWVRPLPERRLRGGGAGGRLALLPAQAALHRAQRRLRGRRAGHGGPAAEAEGAARTGCRSCRSGSATSCAPTPRR